MLEWILLYSFYLLAGFTLKLGDDFLDELDRPNLSWIFLSLSGAFFAYIITNSEYDMVLLTSIIIGVVISGKVNRPQFSMGFILIAVGFLIRGIPVVTDWLEWLAILLILLLAAVLDEKGNDWTVRSANPTASIFFNYRFSLKVTVLAISLVWQLFIFTAVGLWIFDLGYELAGKINQKI
ncbi:MAG: hypothetical protein GF411_06960 [Candidatus Lokiarchaeota archaeon]|nr:hypothetical protein [Candidatus Lokiarchaeota archaeon]